MKEKRILNLLGQVNDDYIAEAAPPKSSKSKHHGVKWGIVASCLCLVLAGVLQLGRKPTLSLSLVMTAYAADGTGYELVRDGHVDQMHLHCRTQIISTKTFP